MYSHIETIYWRLNCNWSRPCYAIKVHSQINKVFFKIDKIPIYFKTLFISKTNTTHGWDLSWKKWSWNVKLCTVFSGFMPRCFSVWLNYFWRKENAILETFSFKVDPMINKLGTYKVHWDPIPNPNLQVSNWVRLISTAFAFMNNNSKKLNSAIRLDLNIVRIWKITRQNNLCLFFGF